MARATSRCLYARGNYKTSLSHIFGMEPEPRGPSSAAMPLGHRPSSRVHMPPRREIQANLRQSFWKAEISSTIGAIIRFLRHPGKRAQLYRHRHYRLAPSFRALSLGPEPLARSTSLSSNLGASFITGVMIPLVRGVLVRY
jgi:hypothetical protein